MLVESLVAVTLLAAALGGSTLLLVQALRFERDTAARTAAVRHAASLADLLRGLVRDDGSALQAVADPGAPPACPVAAGDCGVELVARERIAEWRALTLRNLPADSSAEVELLAPAPPTYLVTIAWPGSGPEAESRLRLAVEP
jgi:hypothetical protein